MALIVSGGLSAQVDTTKSKFHFEGDTRFRIEQDWHSKKSDGTYRDDRTRLRYRFRGGVKYENSWYSTGIRIRTGNPAKQQDPHLTLGNGFKEFGTLPLGLEKLYFKGEWSNFKFWIGKNTFPFKKNNELFWSDNVYPEGIALEKKFKFKTKLINKLNITAGHFIMSTSGQSLDKDSYFQGFQTFVSCFNNRVDLFPALYLFKNIANIPDGGVTYQINYSIFHIGSVFKILKKSNLNLEFDYYNNFENYANNDSISTNLKDQKNGFTVGLKYGKLKEQGNWLFKASYAYIQQYAIVNFMAQNDWARWDYSSFGSADGRLSNFNGIEIVMGYMIKHNLSLKFKYYMVEQIVPTGTSKETGNRVRLDLDIKF